MSIQACFRLARPDFILDVDLTLPERGVSALFGPSGSGKTTLLRCIAGLERADQAMLEVSGNCWENRQRGVFLPPHRRPIGYVFQEASLFPHLDVRGNLEYGMKRTAQRRVAWSQAVELLGIEPLLDRRPETLSGGERQRVAIARALLTSPRLLLLDEPMAALDYQRRQEILPYLERLHDELSVPMIYVSHAMDEVARLADHLVLLDQGHVSASGPLAPTLARLDLPTARSEEGGVVIEATVGAHDDVYHLTRLDFPGGSIQVTGRQVALGHATRLRILARDVSIALTPQEDSSILNRLPARIVALADADHPAQIMVALEARGTPLLARITRRSRDQLALVPGMNIWAQIKAVALLA